MVKASIILATYNKNECLSNTLYSIARQKTSFPFEVCIVDDLSEKDPSPIVREYLPNAKYRRLTKKAGVMMSMLLSAQMAESSSEVFIISSSDVIYVQPFVVEELVNHAMLRTYTTAEVLNAPIDPDMYKDYDEGSLLRLWDGLEGNKRTSPFYAGSRRYGKRRHQFLWSVMREDLTEMVKKDGAGAFCDTLGVVLMKELRFKSQYLDNLKGIHQTHQSRRKRSSLHPCPLFDTCRLKESCRKAMRQITEFSEIYGNNRTVAIGGV